jgi:hypothetical protein
VAAPSAQQKPSYVLTVEAVRWALDQLKSQKIHPFFVAYLFLGKWSAEQDTTTEIQPEWTELADYLSIGGGPPGKPFYRPFWHGTVNDPGRYWLNPNLAGSFAPSSLRNVPARIVDVTDGRFSLKSGHEMLALEHLLYGEPVSTIALGAFIYRDYGFYDIDSVLAPEALSVVFRQDFHYPWAFPTEATRNSPLFTETVPANSVTNWFVLLDDDTVGIG